MLPVDTAWFDTDPQKYLNRPEFIRFQEVAGVDFMDIKSSDTQTLRRAQERFSSQSIIFNEVRKEHAGYGMPFLAYTHDLGFGDNCSNHRQDLDKLFMVGDMFDSLRRRHIALSYAILPRQIYELVEEFSTPLKIANLGSGVGLDLLNVLQNANGHAVQVDNYDVNPAALELGRQLADHLFEKGALRPNSVHYHEKSLTKFSGPVQLAVMVGVICGVDDRLAGVLLKKAFSQLESDGRLLVTSSNKHMQNSSPLTAFLAQHVGTPKDPLLSWGLNFRSRETFEKLLLAAGFKDIKIYDDWNYPGIEELDDEILNSVDTLPSRILGQPHTGFPLALPPEEIRNLRQGYNWIAIARKP